MLDGFGPAWLEQTATQAQRHTNMEEARREELKHKSAWQPPTSQWDRLYPILRIAVPVIAVLALILLLFLMRLIGLVIG